MKSGANALIAASATLILLYQPFAEATTIQSSASTIVIPNFTPTVEVWVKGTARVSITSLDEEHVGNALFVFGSVNVWESTVFCHNFQSYTLDTCVSLLPAQGRGQNLSCSMPPIGNLRGACNVGYKTFGQGQLPGASPTSSAGICSAVGCEESPIVVSIGDHRIELTDLAGGVRFDLNRDGFPERLSWTAPLVQDGFLALDRNGNHIIDNGGELFGDVTDQPPSDERNGFRALAQFDFPASGGNGDGFISNDDHVYASLIIWFDLNHDGVSQDSEMRSLASLDIDRIDLDYEESERRDRHGNKFRYLSKMILENGRRCPVWDVFLLRGE